MVKNLADMLSYTDIQQLSRIAEHYDCQCSSNSKNELIQSILSRVNRRDISEKMIHESSIEDLRFLNSLLFDKRNSFSLEELIARVELTRFAKNEDDHWNPRNVIAKFKHRGWIFNGYSQQTKFLFQVPQDLKKRLCDILTKHFMKTIVSIDEPAVYRDEQKLIRDDIYYFLHFLNHNEVTITVEGFMYKRNVHQILDRMSVREEPVHKEAWRFGYGRRFKEYPNRLSLIYDFCYFNDFIVERDQMLTLTDKGSALVSNGQKMDLSEIYRFWIKLYKVPVKNLQSFVYWIEQLSRNWVTIDSLKLTLCDLIKPFYYDDSQTILEQRILQMMMHLGLVRIGEDLKMGKVIQLTQIGHRVINGIYVPDDEQIIIT